MTLPEPSAPLPEPAAASAPARESRGRRAGRAAAWATAGALGATAITGVALASTHSGSTTANRIDAVPTAANATPAPGEPGRPGDGPMNGRGMGMGMRHGGGPLGVVGQGKDLLHGDLVVKDGAATKNLLVQRGSVTAASATSLTVKSSDGFIATWALNGATKIRAFAAKGKDASASDLKVGDAVTVVGPKSSDTSGTAAIVHVDPTDAQLKAMAKKFKQFGPPNGKGRGPMPGMPAPTGAASSTGA